MITWKRSRSHATSASSAAVYSTSAWRVKYRSANAAAAAANPAPRPGSGSYMAFTEATSVGTSPHVTTGQFPSPTIRSENHMPCGPSGLPGGGIRCATAPPLHRST